MESRWVGSLLRAPRRPGRIVGFGGPVGRPQSGLNNAKDCLFQFVKMAASVGARVSVESLHWNTRAPYRGPTVAHERLWDVDHWNAYIMKHGGPQKVGLALLARQPPTHIVSAPGYHNHLSLNTIPTRQQGPGSALLVAHFHRALKPTQEILAIAESVTEASVARTSGRGRHSKLQASQGGPGRREEDVQLMLASPPLRDCARTCTPLCRGSRPRQGLGGCECFGDGPFETTMSLAAATRGVIRRRSAIVGAIVDMTVAADAKYFVGGMGISTFDRGVVDMRSTRDQYRAAPATPANCTFMVRRHRGQEPSLRHFTSFP